MPTAFVSTLPRTLRILKRRWTLPLRLHRLLSKVRVTMPTARASCNVMRSLLQVLQQSRSRQRLL